ncbi:MAG: GntR family transcriptional regulator [Gemmatimonadota bacterium]|nr:GntR family transcriptional regulator [Gemmatimonadota bacterium]
MPDRRDQITETLRQRILRGLHAGNLSVGDRLPSARELGAEFETDHRVVLDAYRQLGEEGLIEMRRRGGIYVAAPPGFADGMPPISATWLTDLLTQGVSREIPVSELHEWLRQSVETLRLRAVVVAGTQDQVAGLVRELRDDFGLEASGLHVTALSNGAALPIEVRRTDLLLTTEAHAEAVGRFARHLRKPCITISVRPDLIGGEWRLLLRKPVYVVAADEGFIDVLSRFFSGTPNAANLRPLVIGRDDLGAIPTGASVYVTQKAKDLLGDTRIQGNVLPAPRTISTHSARAIIGFIVRENLRSLAARRA